MAQGLSNFSINVNERRQGDEVHSQVQRNMADGLSAVDPNLAVETIKSDVVAPRYSLCLIGVFRLIDPHGRRVLIGSRRSRAIIAMLATATNGERTRCWLQDCLWGSRNKVQGQSSLRRELSNLRATLNVESETILETFSDVVALRVEHIAIDRRSPHLVRSTRGDFLEGFDGIAEDGFEEWLRGERSLLAREREARLDDTDPRDDA
ncbi:MAG: hypothetical protein K2X76_00110 [Sphingomonas sp.]|nr:hypothetical protein [Sphingomonas sp.]